MKPLVLRGCTAEPLGNYLKALGVLRLIGEQADAQARAWWKEGVLNLHTRWTADQVIDFFQDGIGDSHVPIYEPTPIFAPWGGRPGFFKDGNKKAQARLATILHRGRKGGRLRNTVRTIRTIWNDGWLTPELQKEKAQMVASARAKWPPQAVAWLDACIAIEEEPRFGFLYGTGGNEGSADITNNFWELFEEVLGFGESNPDELDGQESREAGYSEETLRSALFGTPRTTGTSRTAGQHFPSAGGSPNSGQGFFGSTSTNPWDVILMMEGCVLFAGATTKRLSQHGKGRAAFPFMVDYLATGEGHGSPKDEAKQDAQVIKCRAEFWMPLWRRPARLAEISSLLSEGRLQPPGGDSARHSVEAMDAIVSLGVSSGIDAFQRVGLFERRGKGYYLAASIGTYPVPRTSRRVLSTVLQELATFRKEAYHNLRDGPGIPDHIIVARNALNASTADLLRQGMHRQSEDLDGGDVAKVLTAAATLEHEVSLLRGRARWLTPVPPLSAEWFSLMPDDPESRLAKAIASITPWGEVERQGTIVPAVDSVRANLLPVSRRGGSWRWSDASRAAVWARGASLFDNLAGVLRRRLIDASRGKGDGLPLWSSRGAFLTDVLALWQGTVNEQRLADLIRALALVESGTWTSEAVDRFQGERDVTPDLHPSAVWFDQADEPRVASNSAEYDRHGLGEDELRAAFALPRVYTLLKLCFLGGRLPARPIERATSSRTGSEPYPPGNMNALSFLQAGRLQDAVDVAVRSLKASGYPAMLGVKTVKRIASHEVDMTAGECRRLAGLLLVPVSRAGLLAALAIKPRPSNH